MLAKKVLMVSPRNFGFNHDTATDNFFQKNSSSPEQKIKEEALREFQDFKALLEQAGIEVKSFSPAYAEPCPDAVFPNNWFSTHPSGEAVLYPMKSLSRRNERHPDIIQYLKSHYKIIIDLTENENQNKFLEGTGSIVPDHENRIAYASISQRTDESLFREWCLSMNYKPIQFNAHDLNGQAVYHTNVMLCIGKGFAIACIESVKNTQEKKLLANSITKSGNALIEVSLSQMHDFSANALALQNKQGKQVLVISKRGWNALDNSQQKQVHSFCSQIITPGLDIIETCGGGSARCMLAELF